MQTLAISNKWKLTGICSNYTPNTERERRSGGGWRRSCMESKRWLVGELLRRFIRAISQTSSHAHREKVRETEGEKPRTNNHESELK